MLKDNIVKILDNHRDGFKNSFGIDDNEINNIKEFLNKEHNSFKTVINDLSTSNLSDRGKMTLCCLIGYINGTLKTQLFENRKNKILEKIRREKNG